MRDLDPASGQAPYLSIADVLRDAIDDGEFEDGEQLPSRTDLASRFGVSPMTVSNAMRLLRDEGVVASVPGRGVFARRLTPKRIDPRAEIAEIRARLERLERLLDERGE